MKHNTFYTSFSPFQIWRRRNGICGKPYTVIATRSELADRLITNESQMQINKYEFPLLVTIHDVDVDSVICYITNIYGICNEDEYEDIDLFNKCENWLNNKMQSWRDDGIYSHFEELTEDFKKFTKNNHESFINGTQWLKSYLLKKQIRDII
jgi:hypothetical protein